MSSSTKNPKSYHHGNLRRALIDRAVTVIGEAGVDALSMRRLAADLGVSHAAPSAHFKDRTALLLAVALEGYTALLGAGHAAAAAAGADAVGRLRAMAVAYAQWADANQPFYAAMVNPELRRAAAPELLAVLGEYGSTVRDAVLAAQGSGWLAGEPVETAYFLVCAMALGAAQTAVDPIYRSVLISTSGPNLATLTAAAFDRLA